MKPKLSTILFASILIVLILPRVSLAATINSASCSYKDVSDAVASANYGDTVIVPECEADWGDNTLVITKGINLLGAGKDKTIIKATPSVPPSQSGYKSFITFQADATTALNDYPFKLDGFYLKANGSYPRYSLLALANSDYKHPLTKVIISNNKFQQLRDSGFSCSSIIIYPAVFGVSYNNEIIDGSGAWRFLGDLATGKLTTYWEPGSPYAMYFEDNYIHISEPWRTEAGISGGGGNRYVSRYNTFDLSLNGPDMFMQAFDIHGNQENNPGAGIGFEAYGNHRLGGNGRWFDHRGGQVYFFMNKWSYTNGNGVYAVWEEYDDDTFTPTSCMGLAYPKTAGGVNCLQRPRDSYYWKNFAGINGTTLATDLIVLFDHFDRTTNTLNNPLTLFENQNWWRDNSMQFTGLVDPIGSCGYYNGPSCTKSGIGCGTYEEMQAIKTCTDGVGFWVTNQGNCNDISEYVGYNHTKNIEGTLYICKSNNWVASYTPYTYPHPLRTETALPDITPPAPPQKVKVL